MSSLSMSTQRSRFGSLNPAILLTLAWAAIVVALAAPAIKTGVFDTMSTDDAMRLVEVRDLLEGQEWFDLTQHRLDPPGIAMHWSRIVDAPLAGMILLLRPLIGQHNAEAITLVLWPSLLIGAALALAALIARQASEGADRERIQLAAVLLAALSIPALIHFRTGAIDHHNLQIVLMLALVLCASDIERSSVKASLAGLFAALSLAIGLEMLPAIAMACVAVAGLLLWKGTAVARGAGLYGASLAASSALLSLILIPSSGLAAPVCDAFGGPVLLLAVGGGISLVVTAAASRAGWPVRLATSVLAGALLLWGFFGLFPGCVASPYAQVDPLLTDFWLDRVAETMSIGTVAQLQPQKLLGYFAFPALTLALCLAALSRSTPQARFRWIVASVTLAALFGVSLWQLRGAAAATIVAAPLFVPAIASLRVGRTDGWQLLRAALIISPASLAGIGLLLWPAFATSTQSQIATVEHGAACQTLSSVTPLSTLEPGRVMAPIDSGPAILAATGHAVFAAPYHRNNHGNLVMVHSMLASPENARELLARHKVDYILTCGASPDQLDLVRMAPDGLAARLGRGEAPDFLEPVSSISRPGLAVWRVRK
ncbi:MAG: hypothetical protein HY852_21415 [Bradyrhizobium sp.]|uniref:hypothetical protein n=1 Tax=Bradyrhizobium sp. TaxID=376 RepID=UPI0025C390ED|nr:hypothetical protein [Bradyrhizobium sp.]MBI5264365.1 hypothetical protein [Bradyrhizobium sp.]